MEDEIDIRNLIEKFLETKGYTVLTAGDGLDALRIFDDHDKSIELMLTDVVMPGMSGGELAEKALSRQPNTKVLYMSGYTDDAVNHPVVDGSVLLQKPFSMPSLARKIREMLDRS